MKKTMLALLVSLVLAAAGAQNSDRVMLEAIDRIGNKSYTHLNVGIGRLTYEYSGLTSVFAKYLEDAIAGALSKSINFALFKPIGAEAVKAGEADIYKNMFTSTGPEGLLTGKWFDDGDSVRLEIEVYNFAFSALVGKETVRIPKSVIPRSLSVKPEDFDRAAALGLIGRNEGTADLKVEIGFDKGTNPVYKEGEKLTVYLFSNKDAYVRLFSVNAKGEITQIFPNQFYRKDFIKGNTLVKIPDPSYSFTFDMTPPFGTEYIKVQASEVPFAENYTAFSDLGQSSKEVLTRGIAVTQKAQGAVFETLGSYRIGPK